MLLHACCAPCSPHVLSQMQSRFDVTVFFYNPNIQPEEEYRRREEEMRGFAEREGFRLVVGEYDEPGWMEAVRGLEEEPEGGARCRVCFRYRLDRAASEAAARGLDVITSTLSVSPHKNARVINEEGSAAAARHGVEFLEADFKKKDGFKISCELSRDYGFYRQDYCGCLFSRRL